MSDNPARAARIRELNDAFRCDHRGCGRLMVTRSVRAEGQDFVNRVIDAVAKFDSFTKDNDPYGEHDFGAIELDGRALYWKFDYYDRGCNYGSEDPADPEITTRVLTIMLQEEY